MTGQTGGDGCVVSWPECREILKVAGLELHAVVAASICGQKRVTIPARTSTVAME